jgi:hypothetical protein
VFFGIRRNSRTFYEIIRISEGESLIKEIPLRFYKSLQKLSISISSTQITINKRLDKELVDNHYLPKHLFFTDWYNNRCSNYLKRKIKIISTKLKYYL